MFRNSLLSRLRTPLLAAITACTLLAAHSLRAADWQWSTSVSSMTSSETGKPPRAFLWIPPTCRQVRAVVIGQHNMEEEGIFEHPLFRKTLADLNFAVIWISPPIDLFYRFDKGADDHFTAMLKSFAADTGYPELEFVPVVPLGHSAAASYPFNYAAFHPERTLAAISVSGQWPSYKDQNTPDWGSRTIDGIPGLVTMGEYEAAYDRASTGLKDRADHPKIPLSMIAEAGAGHFDYSDEKVAYLSLYLRKAAQYRLPPDVPLDRPATLTPIDPARQGWLADRLRKDQPATAPAAPVGQYKGNPKDAFWYFDEELAHATEAFAASHKNKKVQLLGFLQNGQIVPQNPKLHLQVPLKFLPLDDGISFKLSPTYLDTVPPGRPEGWTGLKADSPITHSADTSKLAITRICGPVLQTAPDTFSIRFYRMGMDNPKRTNAIDFLAVHPGDATYKRMVQQAELKFPLKLTQGADQHITFPPIPDQPASTQTLTLSATSDANIPVYFYIREGPAELDGNTLRFTPIPPRAKFPLPVTIVAWQYGRSTDPKLKSADPVEHTFFLTK